MISIKQAWKRFPAYLGLALILISTPIQAQAPVLDRSAAFRAQNDILYTDECAETPGAAADATKQDELGKVYILGDSITDKLRNNYKDQFMAAGATEVKVNASGGGNLGRAGTTGERSSGYDALRKDKDYIKSANTIIIAHGTNQTEDSAGDPSDAAAYVRNTQSHIKKAIDIVKESGAGGKIFWIDVAVTDKATGGTPQYKKFGPLVTQAIHKAAGTNGYTSLSWAKKVDPSYKPDQATEPVKDAGGFIQNDGIHPTSVGGDTLVRFVIAAVKKSIEGGDATAPASNTTGGNASTSSGGGVSGGSNGWVFPVDKGAPITSEFHEDRGYAHRGVDLGANMDAPIYATRDGEVIASGPASGFGNWIVIKHDVGGKRVDSVYGHMKASSLKVKTGDKVKAGQHIAGVGSEGGSTGPHLHYEEWTGGHPEFGGTGPERKPEAVYGPSGEATGEDASAVAGCCPASASSTAVSAGGGGGGGCGDQGYMEGKRDSEANKKQIWSFLLSKGLNDSAAAGIMGNMSQESAFMPDADNSAIRPHAPCKGVVQWCDGRLESGSSDEMTLMKFAAEKGTEWNCLGTQLEYMWYEMTETKRGEVDQAGNELGMKLADALNGKDFPAKSEYSGSDAFIAASIFHDYFERANKSSGEHLGRGERADEVLKEMGGTAASSLGSAGGGDCAQSSSGGIMSADCKELVAKYKQLVSDGKIIETDKSRQEKDLQNCTEDTIECGTGGGKGGVNPYILRAFIGGAETGDGPAKIWSFNTGHDCDGLNHPQGKAVDIVCNGNSSEGGNDAEPKCNAMLKFFYDNYDELKLEELIWQYPPAGYPCDAAKMLCNIGGHGDHIHVGADAGNAK